MEIHFKIIGLSLMILALIHLGFPRYFNWKEELMPLMLINRQIMIVHTFFIGLLVFMIGLLCLTATEDLTTTRLGKTISLGLGIFWTARLMIQFFGYSPVLWRGKRFETVMHVLFSGFWVYLSVVFFVNAMR